MKRIYIILSLVVLAIPLYADFASNLEKARKGDSSAQNEVGRAYFNGEGVKQDYANAVYWYRKAAEQGEIYAQYNLGYAYYNGQGVSQDYSQALHWYRKAGEQGNPVAQNEVGVIYYNGIGVPKDYAQAVLWFYKAAEQGNMIAQSNLGVAFAFGCGVPEDYSQAMYWYKKAMDAGYDVAKSKYEELQKDGYIPAPSPMSLDDILIHQSELGTPGGIDPSVTHVVAEQVGKKIVVSYQLTKQTDVSIQYSTDGGRSYQTMSHISGDVGKTVAAGQRSITWDVLADVEQLVCRNLVFKVIPGGAEKIIFTVNGTEFTMIKVEGGTFTMGATVEQGDDVRYSEKPAHSVTLSSYYIGETEVTQALWTAVMKKNPTFYSYRGDNKPVENVSWNECQTFIRKLNKLLSAQLKGKQFALPTEAQWEYAARGGKKSKGYKHSGSNTLSEVAWYRDNTRSGPVIHPVKTKQANELGLYDMNGNVEEWCQDRFGNYSKEAQIDPVGSAKGEERVLRGGSYLSEREYCRVADRSRGKATWRNVTGLRLVCIPKHK